MKSNINDLEKRGYVDNFDLYADLDTLELENLLNSEIPTKRTIAVHFLGKNLNANITTKLLEILKKEKALYTKIEICNVLEKGKEDTIKKMVNYLGKIGNNQHKELPKSVSKKKSYPLPRDIIARTLGNMNPEYTNELLKVLDSKDEIKISEVLDAIGFMIFYNKELSTVKNYKTIVNTLENHKHNPIILWKSIECLSAFNLKEAEQYLSELKREITEPIIIMEIERSLKIIKERGMNNG